MSYIEGSKYSTSDFYSLSYIEGSNYNTNLFDSMNYIEGSTYNSQLFDSVDLTSPLILGGITTDNDDYVWKTKDPWLLMTID